MTGMLISKSARSAEQGTGCADAGTEAARAPSEARWRRVAREIEAQIAGNGQKPGDRLPSESRLAARHGVSRQTVRLAIKELERRGAVRVVPRDAIYVGNPRLTFSIENSCRFYETALRAGRDPGTRVLKSGCVRAPNEVALWLGLAPHTQTIEIETVGTANAVPVCRSISWFPAERLGRIAEMVGRLGSFAQSLERLGIPRVRRKFSRLTGRPGLPQEARDLAGGGDCFVMVLETLYVDERDVGVQVLRTSFLAEHIEFVVPAH